MKPRHLFCLLFVLMETPILAALAAGCALAALVNGIATAGAAVRGLMHAPYERIGAAPRTQRKPASVLGRHAPGW